MFENNEIDIEDLPQIDHIEWQDMDQKYTPRKLAGNAIVVAVTVVVVGVIQIVVALASEGNSPTPNILWLWLIPLLFAIPLFSWPFLSVPKKGYAVRGKDIVYKSGVFWHTVTAIPFNRIQHVEKSSTPLDRRFRLASLQLFTAGGSRGDLKIDGLSTRTAERLRTFILEQVGIAVESS